MNNKKRRFWEFPWGYKESFLIAFSVLILGFIVEAATGNKGIVLPHWPFNLIIILAFVVYIITSYRMVKHPFMRWLSGVPAAISSISVMTLLILLMGFIRQDDPNANPVLQSIGLTHVTSSWPYFLMSFYLLIILGYATVRRSWPLSVKNFAFFLNHAGLWIVMVAASMGTADLWRLSMTLQENRPVARAYDNNGETFQMPFSLELKDFHIKQYKPNLGLVDKQQRRFVVDDKTQLADIEDNKTGRFRDWEYTVERYIENAWPEGEKFVESERKGAAPALLLSVKNIQNGETKNGWISSGSYLLGSKHLHLSDRYSIAASMPRPKEYSSDIIYHGPGGDTENYTIKVNQPVSIHGWTIYQTGFDEEMGKYSEISIIEIVNDPWIIVVYIGIFMILAGSVYLVWMGRTKNKKENELD